MVCGGVAGGGVWGYERNDAPNHPGMKFRGILGMMWGGYGIYFYPGYIIGEGDRLYAVFLRYLGYLGPTTRREALEHQRQRQVESHTQSKMIYTF